MLLCTYTIFIYISYFFTVNSYNYNNVSYISMNKYATFKINNENDNENKSNEPDNDNKSQNNDNKSENNDKN